MLPKFASHVFHHTQRAAQAAAQNHALRNVLGLQNQGASSSSTGPLANWSNAASGSSWGSAGGAKYNTGSRFYSGYTGAGRAVTQANSSSAQDSLNGRNDDEEEIPRTRSALVIRSRPRHRSSSVHLTGTGRQQRAETFGVLSTVQLNQTRNTHALAKAVGTDALEGTDEHSEVVASPRVLVRRNSTAASNASDLESLESLQTIDSSIEAPPRSVSPKQPASATNGQTASTDPAAPQTVLPPNGDARDNARLAENAEVSERLEAARFSGSHERVVEEVLKFRSSYKQATARDYNNALHALVSTRQSGQPITVILETYNEMLTRQISPNVRTYKTMILALCERDREVERVREQIGWRQNRRKLTGRSSGKAYEGDEIYLAILRKENNFGSAMLVFEAAQTLFRNQNNESYSLGFEVYNALLRSCMIHAKPDAAVRVWGALESLRDIKPNGTCYLHLLGTYSNANDIESAKDVFDEFLLASKENRVNEAEDNNNYPVALADEARPGNARVAQMLMWVKMIDAYFRARQPVKALGMLEQMMDSKAPVMFGRTDVPLPCTSVYTSFIRGFVDINDMSSALKWFNRLLEQETVTVHPLMPSSRTPRPDQLAWNILFEGLLEREMVAEANEKFRQFHQVAESDGLSARTYDCISLFTLNVKTLRDLEGSEFDERVKFITEYIIGRAYGNKESPLGGMEYQTQIFGDLLSILAERGRVDKAVAHFERFMAGIRAEFRKLESRPGVTDPSNDTEVSRLHYKLNELIHYQVLPAVLFDREQPPLEHLVTMENAIEVSGYIPGSKDCVKFMKLYNKIKARGDLEKLSTREWRTFSAAAARLLSDDQTNLSKVGLLDEIKSFIRDVCHAGYDVRSTWLEPSALLAQFMAKHFGEAEAYEIFKMLGPEWTRVAMGRLASAGERKSDVNGSLTPPNNGRPIRVTENHSRFVDEYFPNNPRITPKMAWARYEEGAAKGLYPTPDVMGRMIATFGRLNDLGKVHRLYQDAQRILTTFENDKERQSVGWYTIEDQMIVALAHAGQVEKAHIHRQRIIDQGGNPSADAYGALIQCVRETTDDSANALALWNEAQMRGVVANLYLFNTVISKLSRARKADYALELFQQMKANFVRPSSVTYGAIIAACCRVGDSQSAEVLFEEMTSQKNFKPRIPPYNTMIQFYTHILRDRQRALYYFGELLKAGITPTAHTYKLLIDCYGTIEPSDIASMEDVFLKLSSERNVQVQGVHWAALVNAYGCVQKDLDRAVALFDSIATHPTTQRSGLVLPDAIVYESMINVLVTLRRTDLIGGYLERLTASGIHMTAYIANLLIKGYATAGDVESARQVFESLQDPPTGHAAPNNHVPHSPNGQLNVAPTAPVYREPSTWEAMVRAELGNGQRDHAMALLYRVQERQFPPAVYARISGIMLDGAVSPWSSLNVNIMDTSSGQHSPQ